MKGKNDRMALAATEKAKVWTSVRRRYLTVETDRPKRNLPGFADGVPAARAFGEIEYDFWSIKRIFVSYQMLADAFGQAFHCSGESRARISAA
jgi:hypothetical protein